METIDPITLLAWSALIIGFGLGALGTILPGLPGAVFIIFGLVVHKMILPEVISWLMIAVISVLALLTWVADVIATLLGAKMGGATKYGLIGASIGGLIGLVFGIPGLLLGPFVGAVLGDLYAKKTDLPLLLKSGGGAALGFLISMIFRLILLAMIALLILIAIIV